jgi:hypothetical protein
MIWKGCALATGIAVSAVLAMPVSAQVSTQTDTRRPADIREQPGSLPPVERRGPTEGVVPPVSGERQISVNLTEAECKGLGGKVRNVVLAACPGTGKICRRADENGVIHSACITK